MIKRILITTHTFPPEQNGVANVAYAHAKELSNRGYSVTVATKANSQRDNSSISENIKVIEFEVEGSYLLHRRYRGTIKEYQNFIAEFPADIIMCHCWQIWTTDLAVPMFHKNPAKKILISHGVSVNSIIPGHPSSIISWLLWRPYVKKMPGILKKFDHVTFLSNYLDKDRFYDLWLMNKHKLTHYSIIPNGVNIQKFDRELPNFRQIYDIETNKLILCVSNFSSLKNQKFILATFLQSELKNTTLVFIGSEINAYASKLNKMYMRQRTEYPTLKVIFLEKISEQEICAAYKAASLFLFASKTEVQPLVILDAMAAGVPFISTNVGCISNMPGGLVANSKTEMLKYIKHYLNNIEECYRLRDRGINACKTEFRWNKVIDSYEKVFNQI
jgi:glycosyltransferase involved in cell wall biosynthesis